MIGLCRRVGGSEQDLRLIAKAAPDAPGRVWFLLEQARRGWLLVVDNADDPGLLAAPAPVGTTAPTSVADGTGWVRPTRRGLVIVTSRIADPRVWGLRSYDVHRLDVLGETDATQVLLDLVQQTRQDGSRARRRARTPPPEELAAARELAIGLGRLPLALYLAGAAIASQYSSWGSFADYLQEFNVGGSELLSPAPDTPLASDPRAKVLST
jgi:hypothetical protein